VQGCFIFIFNALCNKKIVEKKAKYSVRSTRHGRDRSTARAVIHDRGAGGGGGGAGTSESPDDVIMIVPSEPTSSSQRRVTLDDGHYPSNASSSSSTASQAEVGSLKPRLHRAIIACSYFTARRLSGANHPLPSNRHHRRNGDCLEGKGGNYQACSVQYCVQQLCTVQCTHI